MTIIKKILSLLESRRSKRKNYLYKKYLALKSDILKCKVMSDFEKVAARYNRFKTDNPDSVSYYVDKTPMTIDLYLLFVRKFEGQLFNYDPGQIALHPNESYYK